ncbi:jacalin-related lectin 3-like [Papaver somniferum]|uniref:jacalin-related lectin 3-like n=1 Tax=Papaver somniferum TaxID=3469 RepID=UPI000E6F91B4|nr:jacalin-related lectin 3-like [Papaver somniferum]
MQFSKYQQASTDQGILNLWLRVSQIFVSIGYKMFNSFRRTDHVMGYDKKNKRISNKSSIKDNLPICAGPWPSTRQEGDPWDDGFHTTVKQLVIVHGAGIDSIRFEYRDNSGNSFWSQKHGGSGGFKTDKIKLDFPGEYIKSISGYYGSVNDWSPVFIRSLTIESNRMKYGPFGSQLGTQFSFPATSRASKIVGFHGHSSWYLTSIGVYLKPLEDQENQNILPSKALMSSQLTSQNFVSDFGSTHDHTKGYSVVPASSGHVQKGSSSNLEGVVSYGPWGGNGGSMFDDEVYTGIRQVKLTRSTAQVIIVKEPVPHGPGPWGGDGGKTWDDGAYTGIKQIHLTKTEAILSIQIQYDRNGRTVWSARHGGSSRGTTIKIKFHYPDELLTCITGYYGAVVGEETVQVIKSLTFYTTRGKYGPYGVEAGTFFSSTMTEGKVVGFHGRCSSYLDAIGVHMQNWLGNIQKPSKSIFSKIFK